MPNGPSFVEHALDLLSLLGPVQARPMFGGHGIYAQGVMFGLLDDDELFVRTDEESRAPFLEAGCRMWVYPGLAQTSYYRPPDGAHEDAEAMLPWARLGLDAALRRRAARDAAARARAERRAEREARAAARPKPPGKASAKPSGRTARHGRKRPAKEAATGKPAPALKRGAGQAAARPRRGRR